PNLVIDGVLTHLANADLNDTPTNTRQLEQYQAALERLKARDIRPTYLHVANSAGVVAHPQAHVGLLRPGLLLYGYTPIAAPLASALRPMMRWTTKAVHIKTVSAGTPVSYGGRFVTTREARLATLPVGYADGYPRAMTGKAHVLVRGQRVPIVGAICMDLCMADVTDVADV